MKFKNKNVLVYGLGKSGVAASNLLNSIGANVLLFDDDKLALKSLENSSLLVKPFDLIFNLTLDVLSFIDLVVINPAVSLECENVLKIKEKNIPIISELELGFLFSKGKIIAITGTNGKTTTVELITHILKTTTETHETGNIGIPFCESVKEHKNSTYIVEVSSFQLETIKKFRPNIACLLNITPDHLNRHKTMENYRDIKAKIFENMKSNSSAILNADDELTMSVLPKLKSKVYLFSTKKEVENGIFIKDNQVIFVHNKKQKKLFEVNVIPLLGEHNLSNVLCATLVALLSKVQLNKIIDAIKSFSLGEHRMQKIAVKKGITFYDDSKGTNIDATIKAVNSLKNKIVLMLGGSYKGENYDALFQNLDKTKMRAITVSGHNAEKMIESAKKFHINLIKANCFEESFKTAVSLCKKNDVLLLSPASASFDEFKNYAERGNKFQELVAKL